MLRFCVSGGFHRFLPLTLKEGYMSQFQQQRSIRTTIPSHYRKISEIIENELIRIKSSTRVVTRADCVCESLKDIADVSEILDCCPFNEKELDDDKLSDGEMCRLCQAEDEKIPRLLLDLAQEVCFDRGDGEYQEAGDDDEYDVNEDTAELAQAAGALSIKNFAQANGIKLTTREELDIFANFFFFNTQLLHYWKRTENYFYTSHHLTLIGLLIYELPKFALDANDIEDFKKWMEFVQTNLQEKDTKMALMIEKKKERMGAKKRSS